MTQQIVVPARNPNPPPPPPNLIADDPIAVEYWNAIWSEGVAVLWTASDQHAAARAAHMQGAVARCGASGEAMTRLNVQIMKLEATLLLTPTARRVYNIVIEAEGPPRERKSRKEALEARLADVG
jgi:hypothetical protein